MANGFGPRIQNISADELRRLFEAPEIQKPGFTVSDAINLSQALEQRRRNDLEEKRKIAELERKIAEEEQKARDINTLATTRGTRAAQTAETTARENIDPTQTGPEVGPLTADDQAAISQAQQAAEAEFRLDPTTALSQERALERDRATATQREKEATTAFERKEKFTESEFERELKKLDIQTKQKEKTKKQKLTALQQSKIFQTEGFASLVDSLKKGAEKLPDSLGDSVGVKLNTLFRGRISNELNAADNVTFQDARESFSVAVYKFLSGDVGNIAASESKRALRLIPDALDDPAVRRKKIHALQEGVTRARAALQKLANDPTTADMTPEQLEAAQRNIANQTIAEVSAGIGPDTSSAAAEGVGTTDLGDGFSFEEVQ